MSTARQREQERFQARLMREVMAALVYKALGGTPFESVLEGLPNLQEILSKIRREHASESSREHSQRAHRELAKRQEVISARNARNAGRHNVMRLARHVDRYVALEERGKGQVELETFIRARGPRTALDCAAGELGLSRAAMWHRFSTAVAAAKQTEGGRLRQDLEDAVNAVDWDAREAKAQERRSNFPNDSTRWSTSDDETLRILFDQLWDQGLEPPLLAERDNRLLQALSAELGRTPSAIWQRLVRQGLRSAIPARNEDLNASRRGEPR